MSEPKENPLMEKIVSLCKRRGFIFQSSEIYGGINGFWDYGPLGAELKRNVKESWWQTMTRQRDDVVGLEATIIMSPEIWKASGHVATFADLMVECPVTKKRFRADQVDVLSGEVYQFPGAIASNTARSLVTEFINHPKFQTGKGKEIRDAILAENTIPALVHKMMPLIEEAFLMENLSDLATKISQLGADGQKDLPYSNTPIKVLIYGKQKPGAAYQAAKQFYKTKGIADPVLLKPEISPIENTQRFNPENGFELSEARPFNLMFKTYVGPLESEENVAYLRPETAQAIFAQFKNVLETSRQKVPFGIAQIGKAFRNEVTPRNFTFRSREFEQMELEFFIKPDEAVEAISSSVATPTSKDHPGEPQPNWGWQLWHQYWVEERIKFYGNIGLPRTTLEEYWQKPGELAHYARATVDLLFKFPFGTQELEGIAARSDFDLSQHARFSGKPMGVFDDELKAAWTQLPKEKQDALWRRYYENRKKYLVKSGAKEEDASKSATEDANGLARGQYIPHVIEPSAGVDRLILALICNAYNEDQAPDEKGNMETRVVLRFAPCIAPVKVAIFPLLKNKPDLVAKAKAVRDLLRPHMNVFYDEAGAIGRRYRRQDEIGTPFCVTIDFDTLGEKGDDLRDTVTLRDRDSMKQERLKIPELLPFLLSKIR
jgi:glycyl-tRNA synthetase